MRQKNRFANSSCRQNRSNTCVMNASRRVIGTNESRADLTSRPRPTFEHPTQRKCTKLRTLQDSAGLLSHTTRLCVLFGARTIRCIRYSAHWCFVVCVFDDIRKPSTVVHHRDLLDASAISHWHRHRQAVIILSKKTHSNLFCSVRKVSGTACSSTWWMFPGKRLRGSSTDHVSRVVSTFMAVSDWERCKDGIINVTNDCSKGVGCSVRRCICAATDTF